MKNASKELYMVIVILFLMLGIFGLLFMSKPLPNEIVGCLIAALGGFFGFAQHRTVQEIEQSAPLQIEAFKPDSQNSNDSDIPVI